MDRRRPLRLCAGLLAACAALAPALPGFGAPCLAQEDTLPGSGAESPAPEGEAAADQEAGPGPLAEALRSHRYPLRLLDDSLAGPAVDLLVEESRRSRFLVVGEDHGVAEVPGITALLFRRLSEIGYRHLAIEASPTVAEVLEEEARWDPEEMVRHAAQRGIRIPFYSWLEESRLLARAVAASDTRADVLWGLDQEYIAGTETAFRRLYELAPEEAARQAAVRGRRRATYGMTAARRGDPSRLWLPSADSSDFARLREAFRESEPALRLIDRLETSSRIYRLYFDGERYAANALRERLLKENFMRYYREAERLDGAPPRVVVKIGGGHALRGQMLFARVHSLGNFLSELAVAEGSRSFHLLLLGGEGSLTTEVGPGLAFRTGPGATTGAGWLRPVVEELPEAGWALFDLRPLRPLVADGTVSVNALLEQVIWGYDALAVLTGSTPATYR